MLGTGRDGWRCTEQVLSPPAVEWNLPWLLLAYTTSKGGPPSLYPTPQSRCRQRGQALLATPDVGKRGGEWICGPFSAVCESRAMPNQSELANSTSGLEMGELLWGSRDASLGLCGGEDRRRKEEAADRRQEEARGGGGGAPTWRASPDRGLPKHLTSGFYGGGPKYALVYLATHCLVREHQEPRRSRTKGNR